ncbi:hypothetical protein HDU76_013149, partial [Blyttiomyces sp. JEL0837]
MLPTILLAIPQAIGTSILLTFGYVGSLYVGRKKEHMNLSRNDLRVVKQRVRS